MAIDSRKSGAKLDSQSRNSAIAPARMLHLALLHDLSFKVDNTNVVVISVF